MILIPLAFIHSVHHPLPRKIFLKLEHRKSRKGNTKNLARRHSPSPLKTDLQQAHEGSKEPPAIPSNFVHLTFPIRRSYHVRNISPPVSVESRKPTLQRPFSFASLFFRPQCNTAVASLPRRCCKDSWYILDLPEEERCVREVRNRPLHDMFRQRKAVRSIGLGNAGKEVDALRWLAP